MCTTHSYPKIRAIHFGAVFHTLSRHLPVFLADLIQAPLHLKCVKSVFFRNNIVQGPIRVCFQKATHIYHTHCGSFIFVVIGFANPLWNVWKKLRKSYQFCLVCLCVSVLSKKPEFFKYTFLGLFIGDVHCLGYKCIIKYTIQVLKKTNTSSLTHEGRPWSFILCLSVRIKCTKRQHQVSMIYSYEKEMQVFQ